MTGRVPTPASSTAVASVSRPEHLHRAPQLDDEHRAAKSVGANGFSHVQSCRAQGLTGTLPTSPTPADDAVGLTAIGVDVESGSSSGRRAAMRRTLATLVTRPKKLATPTADSQQTSRTLTRLP
jgi:hypothetical protein